MRDSRINYVLVGAFVIAMVAAGLVSIAMLTGRAGRTDTYYTVFSNVSGINEGTKVLFEGYPVGQVAAIAPVREDSDMRFRLALAVREGWPIPADSVAVISASGLLSAVVVEIRGGQSGEMLEPGQHLASLPSGNLFAVMSDVANELTDLSQNSLRPLLATMNQQIQAVGSVLQEKAPELLANLVAVSADLARKTPQITDNVQEFSVELTQSGRQLNRLLSEGNVQRIEAALANVDEITANFLQLTRELEDSRVQVNRLLDSVEGMIAENRGDIGTAVRDLRQTMATMSRSIGAITDNLETASRNFSEFTRQVRQDPSLILRGTGGGRDGRR